MVSRRSLVVVGVGFRAGLDTTPETQAYLRRADKVLYLVADALAADWIEGLNPTAESLSHLYANGVEREEIYAAIVDRILYWVRRSRLLCVAFYGHPGVFCYVGYEAMRRARLENADARMLPAISAADCLFADLGVDPGERGCQIYEATGFLLFRYRFDPCAALLLWQIGTIGNYKWPPSPDPTWLRLLVGVLGPHYGGDHEVVIYEAAWDPISDPSIRRLPLVQLPQASMTSGSTLYVPPTGEPQPNSEVLEQLDSATQA